MKRFSTPTFVCSVRFPLVLSLRIDSCTHNSLESWYTDIPQSVASKGPVILEATPYGLCILKKIKESNLSFFYIFSFFLLFRAAIINIEINNPIKQAYSFLEQNQFNANLSHWSNFMVPYSVFDVQLTSAQLMVSSHDL